MKIDGCDVVFNPLLDLTQLLITSQASDKLLSLFEHQFLSL